MRTSVRLESPTTWSGSPGHSSTCELESEHRTFPKVSRSLSGRPVAVASLADVIRSKEAANRPKDQTALPALRLLRRRLTQAAGDR
jgi:hypothetical protein